jgi:glycosyltransferase involved in cell wall biosynthesis
LGHRHDVPQLMQSADVLLMPSIEEGFALVCAEAIGAGCVPLASDACTEMCRHMENALVHHVGDVSTLRQQITEVFTAPELLARLRAGALASRLDWTWNAAGTAYEQAVERHQDSPIIAGRPNGAKFAPAATC